jgi:hypothetical protein
MPRATDGHAPSAGANRTALVRITSAKKATFAEGSLGTFTVKAVRPSSTIRLSKVGRLASGVRFSDRHDGTAVISGTPRQGAAGIYTIVIDAWADRGGGEITSPFTLVVREAQASTFKRTTTRKTAAKMASTFKRSTTRKTAARKATAFKRAGIRKAAKRR